MPTLVPSSLPSPPASPKAATRALPPKPPRPPARPTGPPRASILKRKSDVSVEIDNSSPSGGESDVKKAKLPPPPGPTRPLKYSSPPVKSAGGTEETVIEDAKVQILKLKDGIGKDEWKGLFPKERLKSLAALYRTRGRELKHAGDSTGRQGVSPCLAIIQQTEAILFYVFSFWCEDQANKICTPQSWISIFGLITFVKRAAEGKNLAVIVGICCLIESYALHILSHHDQRTLPHQASRHFASATTVVAPSPAGSANSPPQPSQSSPPVSLAPSSLSKVPSPLDLLKSFSKSSSDILRSQKLWEDSSSILSPFFLKTAFPCTWKQCLAGMETDNRWIRGGGDMLPVLDEGSWRFAYPLRLEGAINVVDAVTLGRCLLEELAGQLGENFVASTVAEA